MAEAYGFGRFILDQEAHRLYADGVAVSLGNTDIRVLEVLVENAGALVLKEDLIARVWRKRAITDNALYVRVNALRRILGEDVISNRQGRGYKFIAPVQRIRKPKFASLEKVRLGNLPTIAAEGLHGAGARLIGRVEQLREASKLLKRNRMVTFTGPGGVGKTTLAMHVANRNESHFPDGVWLVELATLTDEGLVLPAIAQVFGIEVGDSIEPVDTLTRQLMRKSLLIVLDNCEHVVGIAGVLCNKLIGAAPGIKILATSREALRCTLERVLEVPPLALPRSNSIKSEAIRRTAAIELFAERAMSANSSFSLSDQDITIAARICRRVDALPLAIEMVAGWAGILGLETLEDKLEGSIRGWLHARGATSPRHSTMRATLEWSYSLLSETEKAVLRRLAAFAGAFDLNAAEAVAGGDGILSEQVTEHVATLVSKSMIAMTPGRGARSYRLLQTSRAFLAERLGQSDEYREVRQRHANFMLALAWRATDELENTRDDIWQENYRPIIDDLRNALDWTTEFQPRAAVALAGASSQIWHELSLLVEGRRRLAAAAAFIDSDTPQDHEAHLRAGLGDLWLNSAPVKQADAELHRAAELYRALGDQPRLGDTLGKLAFAQLVLDQLDAADRTNAEALALLDSGQRPRMLSRAYATQMCTDARLGRFPAARLAGQRAVELCEITGATRAGLIVSANLVELTLDNGDFNEAVSMGRGVAKQLRETPYSDILGFLLGVLTGALVARGDLDEALATAKEAAPLLRDSGSVFWVFDQLVLRLGLAGHLTDAALLAGYADAVHEKNEYPRWPMGARASEKLRTLLRETLDETEIARLCQLGAKLTEEQVLARGLSD